VKKAIILIVFMLVAGVIFGQEFTFRGLPWGSSVNDIIAKEGQPDSNTNGQLIYQNKNVAGYNAMLLFNCSPPYSDPYVEKYGLRTTQYQIPVTNANSESVYGILLDKLSKLYGQPIPGGTKPYRVNIKDRYNYWVVFKTKITLTLLYSIPIDLKENDKQVSLITISYYSPDSTMNEFGDL